MAIDPVSGAMLGSAASSVIGSLLGGNSAKKAAKQQAEAAARAEAMYSNINIPTMEEQKLLLDRYLYEGNFDPETLEALGLGPSAMESAQADQQSLDAQVDALNKLKETSDGGLTEGDLAAARQIQRKTDSSDIARRKSILNEMAQRGTLGSGMELAAKLQGAQDSTQNQAEANDRLIQEAQARALQALSQQGSLASNLRSQSFNEQSAKAQAKDAINKFNVANRQDISNQNVSNRNVAQERNLNARQALNNANVGIANTEQTSNKGLYQTQFGNQMDLANAKAGRAMATGQAQAGVDAARANMAATIGSGLANAGGAFAGYLANKGPSLGSQVSSMVNDPKNKGIF